MTDKACGHCGMTNAAYGNRCYNCGDDWTNAVDVPYVDDPKPSSPPPSFLRDLPRPIAPSPHADRCPECGSTDLYASDIYTCNHCHAGFHPRDVVRAGRDLPCPSCQGPLEPSKPSGSLPGCYGCPRCGGVWLDNATSQIIVRRLDPKVLALASLYESKAAEGAGAPSTKDGPLARICPISLDALARVSVAGVALDVCRTHGTWFDAGELAKVADRFEAERTSTDPLPADVRRVLETVAGAYRSSGRRG